MYTTNSKESWIIMPPYNLKDTYFSLKRIISGVLGGAEYAMKIYSQNVFQQLSQEKSLFIAET